MIQKIYNSNKDEKPFKFGKEADNALATLKNLNQVIDGINASGGIYTAGTILGGQRVVMISGGQAVYFDPTNDNNAGKHLGMTVSAANAGEEVGVADNGTITNPGWNLTPDAVYYAAPAGMITAIIPTSGLFQRVGVAVNNNTLKLDFSEPISLT